MDDPAELRISDQDRERAAGEIREHFAQGRLDQDELSERLDRAYSAKTTGELTLARANLPSLPAGSAQGELSQRRAELTRELLQQTGAGLVPFLICSAIWLFTGMSGGFWPVWTLPLAAFPLIRNGWHLYGPAPDLDRAAEDLTARRHRDAKRSEIDRR